MKKKLVLIFLVFLVFGCKENNVDQAPKIDEDSFLNHLEYAPLVSAYRAKIVDKYEFPDLSGIPGMTDWMRPNIIQERIDAYQIPDALLTSISTEGLLETCLEFPYGIDIFFCNDYQKGFEALLREFNGYRELFKRPDLVDVLIVKYYCLSLDVTQVRTLSLEEQGGFSLRQFVFEMMLVQDVVLENLSEEQERQLFLLSFEHIKIKKSYPDIFSDLNFLPTALLYAKKIMNDNQASADMQYVLSGFIRTPRHVEQDVINYLENYVRNKFK